MKNRILSYIFLVIIMFLAFDAGFISEFEKLISSVSAEMSEYYTRSEWEKNIDSNPQFNVPSLSITVDNIIANCDKEIVDECSLDTMMAETCGVALKVIGNRGYYSDQDEFLYFTESGYCVYRADYNTVEYELDQMKKFKQFLDNKGVKLLYVNEPSKYVDDIYFLNQFGKQSFLNDNMNRFLAGLDDAEIKYLDLRESALNDGIDVMEMFYRTDHHWNVPAAKWAAEKIVNEMNKDCSFNFDSSIYDNSKYIVTNFEKSWLGEQGRKMSKAYTGMEDYTVIKPNFETKYTINNSDGTSYSASFDDFVMTNVYLSTASPYTSTSWHYSYEIPYGAKICNDNVTEGKILVLGDSYEACLLPFLSLGVQSINYACLRDTDMTAEEIVEMGDYDVVIMAYAQFMVGAHDTADNPNYNMFNLARGKE